MTRTLGDITSELKEKVLAPAKVEAGRILEEARFQADRIILEAKEKASRIEADARQLAEVTKKQMETDMATAARNFILLVKERLENDIVQPVVEDEIRQVLDNKDFLSSIIEALITEFARVHGRENRIDILLPERQKDELEEWFIERFLHRTAEGLTVRFSDEVTFGFRLSLGESGAYFNFGEGLVEVFTEFCSPRFRKYFITSEVGS